MKDVLQGLLMAAAVAAALPIPDLAFAQSTDLATSVSKLTGTELHSVPDIISAVFYIGGAALVGAGLLKLKTYAEAPHQNKLGEGVGRLSVGAGLLALPYVSTMVINSFGFGTAAASYQGFNPVS